VIESSQFLKLILNEPETRLHPDLLPALARLIVAAAKTRRLLYFRTRRCSSKN
jgi:predicted ATPase